MVLRHAFLGAFFFAAVVAACHPASSAGGTTCQSAPLCPGQRVDACTTTDDSGACTKVSYSLGGKESTCAACGDCTAAATAMVSACTGSVGDAGGLGDAAPFGGDGAPATEAGGDGGGNKPVTACDAPQSCLAGGTLQHCATTLGGACVSEAYAFSDGTRVSCACGDCAQVAALAEAKCLGPPDAGTDANTCGTSPALHPEATPGVYCPFTAAGPAICAAGQQCCEPPLGSGQSSVCAPSGTACGVAGSRVWRCEDALDCAGSAAGPVCCGVGAIVLDATCGFHRGTAFTGSHCAASCAAGEITICESAAQCPAGKTCTPFKTDGLAMGVCL